MASVFVISLFDKHFQILFPGGKQKLGNFQDIESLVIFRKKRG